MVNRRHPSFEGTSRLGIWVFGVAAVFASGLRAQQPGAPPKPPVADEPIREIYVPFEDLNVILENDKHRVFLTREEYEALVKAAKAKPQTPAPHKVVLVAAEYEGQLEDGRALITGQLTLEVLEDGLFALPLELGGVGIRSATLDGKPAPLLRHADTALERSSASANRPAQGVLLLVQGKGPHPLQLQLTAPLATAAAQQTLQVTLPSNAATRLRLSVPGNVDVKGGAAVLSRTFDMSAGRTLLELLPQRGGMAVVMSLNNRLFQEERVLVARSVIVDEVTQGYERIHATISYRVLHGAVDKLRLAVPTGFEVTQVDSVLLARWEEKTDADGKRTLEASLREPTSEQIVLRLTANRSPDAAQNWLAGLADWKFPHLAPLDAAGQVAVVGLVVEDRLQPEKITADGLVPIDSAALAGAIPASVLKSEPGAPVVRQVVSYYAPSGEYSLSAAFLRPPAGLKVAANSLLVIGDQGLTLQGGFALTPQAESLFAFQFTLPVGWQVTQVTSADGTGLPIERYPIPAGGTRVAVRLSKGISVGRTQTINYQAVLTPAGWLADWTAQKVEFPKILVEGSTSDTGALAAQTVDDLVVRPETLTGLTPLLDTEKATFGLGNIPTALAYRFENRDFAAGLVIERTAPSLAAQAYSFLKLDKDNLLAHYELSYDVREARTRRITFSLPMGTPTELTIRGLANTVVKEFSSRDEGDRRRWTVQLAERQGGSVRLVIDFTQRLPERSQQKTALPLVQAEDVEYQSALVAVEGDAELDVSVTTTAREIDIGELAGAEYQLGRRVIGTFGYVGTQIAFQATIAHRDAYALPPALIQRAELVTKVSAAGRAQSVARYDLLTKATLLEIRLPAESTLWTVYLDDQPTKPQREKESLLVSLPAQERLAVRKLQLVYESPSAPLGLSGTIDAVAPLLLVRAAGTDAEREIPQADLQWQLVLPSGYSVRRAGGTVDTDEIPPRELAAVKVARFLYELAGGIHPWYVLSARESARRAQLANSFHNLALSSADYSDRLGTAATPEAAGLPSPAPAAPTEMMAESRTVDEIRPKGAERPRPATAGETHELARVQRSMSQLVEEHRTELKGAEKLAAGIVPDAAGKVDGTKLWALEGFSSLWIDIESDSAPATTFRSLGDQPQLAANVIDQRRLDAAAWGLALLVALVGVGLTLRAPRDKALYVLVVLLAATVPPLLTTAFDEVGQVFDYVFFAGCGLVVWYFAAALALRIYRWAQSKLPADCCQPVSSVQQIAALLIAVSIFAWTNRATAEELPQPESVRIVNIKELLPLLEHDQSPVTIPADAVIVPYDPEKPRESAAQEKILVPYAKYVELWNLAHPDKRIETAPPPFGYAIAGTAYEATLAKGDFLSLVGRMEIDVYGDKPVAVPLQLVGGVLERATVDGQAARLQLVEPQTGPVVPRANGASPSVTTALPPRMLLLHLSGKGRKSVQLNIRLGLSRQGGWRIVRGQLPVGPAAALALAVPDAGTEIRQSSLADRATFETKAANEKIETALGENGSLDLQWRPKVAEGMVDQALTANSLAAFDVREDSLRMTWQVKLEFGRALRDAFSFTAPADYLLEQATGDNVRGWTVKTQGNLQRIDVTLLKPVQGSETVTLHLAKRGRVGQGELTEFDAPAIPVEGAALEQGQIAVRRSPRLELRTLSATGLSRADSGGQTAAIEQLADAADPAVLVVRAFQVFRFVRPPFRLTLATGELPQEATAEVRAALRIAERDTTLDAALIFRPQGQPLYRVRLYLPDGFTLDRLGPGDLEWSVTTENNRQLLTVQLLDGRTGEFTLTLFGKITPPQPAAAQAQLAANQAQPRSLPAPKIEVLDVVKQEGEIVILPDPDTDVRLDGLRNCEGSPITTSPGWMKAEQQPLAKAVLRYRSADYAATLNLTSRLPLVSARSITNLKITPRSIEETLLINFQIEQAGIRRVAFLVPQHLAKARLKAPLLKQKSVEPAIGPGGQPIAGMVRMTLELQDYVRGQYAVLLEQDRLLATGKQTVSLPVIETGRTDRRLVAVENAGRDEVVIEPSDIVGLEPVNRQQQAWRELSAVLGDNVTLGFAAQENAAQSSLGFAMLQRQEAERAGARIGLATTLLVVDSSGTYRALVQYRVTNATEQFLELTLPAGARLWTALVAGEPVKPAEATPPKPGVVRIPLVKTAEGEGDYLVELKYGGRMPTSVGFNSVSFPLIRQTSINVELSQVRLLLPQSQQWFNFTGTMRRVVDEGELAAGFQSYLNKRIQEAAQALTSTSDYTKVRAAVNLKQSRLFFDDSRSMATNELKNLGLALQNYHDTNAALLDQAEQQAQEQLAVQRGEQADNRGRLNEYFQRQDVQRSKNVVSELGSNFDANGEVGKSKAGDAFNPSFLELNKLRTEGEVADGKSKLAALMPAKPGEAPGMVDSSKESSSRFFRGGKPKGKDDLAQDGRDQPAGSKAPEIAAKRELDELQKKLSDEVSPVEELARRAGGERAGQLQRYQQNLEMNLAAQPQSQQPQASPDGGYQYGAFGGRGGSGPRGAMTYGGAGGGVPLANAPVGQPAGVMDPFAVPSIAYAINGTAAAGGEQMAQVAGGLASLDVILPQRGTLYSFTTPRGEIEIAARSLPLIVLSRLLGLAAVLVATVFVWFLSRQPWRRIGSGLGRSTAFGIALAILGLASVVLGIFPVAGLIAIVAGIVITIRSRMSRPSAAQAVATA